MFYKKKSLGQIFLKNVGVIRKIVDAGKIVDNEVVLEIGPGEGNLTAELLRSNAKVIAVEKDDRLIPILKQKFSKEILSEQLHLIHSDILEFSPSSYKLQHTGYKLIANIPYYITGEILRKALSEWPQPSLIVLLVQKEVAERIIARDEKESLLSMSVKIYGNPKIVGVVKAGSFVPMPKVDSAILAIENISKNKLLGLNEEKIFEVLRAGFSHKRKIIFGNLKSVFGIKTELTLTTCKIALDMRAEKLTLENWLCLATKSYKG